MAGPADALQEGRDRARRTDLANEVDIADIDPELERGGRDQRLQLAAFEPLLGREPELFRHAAVMGGDGALAETLGQLAGDPFRHPAGVDENQRRAVLLDEFRQAGVDLGPDLARHHRLEWRIGHFHTQVAAAMMPGVDGRDLGGGPAVSSCAGEEMGDHVNRILGRGEADALQLVAAERRQPFERQREVGAALVRRDGVNFVDDDRPGGSQHGPPRFRPQENVERLRRRHQDVRRAAAHALSFGGRGVAGPDPGADLDVVEPALAQPFADARQRRLEIAVDIVRQRLERGDVDDLGRVGQATIEALPDHVVDRRQKGGERLARSGWRGDEGVPAGLDRRPSLGLSRRRRSEAVGEPAHDRRMEQRLKVRRRWMGRKIGSRAGRRGQGRP